MPLTGPLVILDPRNHDNKLWCYIEANRGVMPTVYTAPIGDVMPLLRDFQPLALTNGDVLYATNLTDNTDNTDNSKCCYKLENNDFVKYTVINNINNINIIRWRNCCTNTVTNLQELNYEKLLQLNDQTSWQQQFNTIFTPNTNSSGTFTELSWTQDRNNPVNRERLNHIECANSIKGRFIQLKLNSDSITDYFYVIRQFFTQNENDFQNNIPRNHAKYAEYFMNIDHFNSELNSNLIRDKFSIILLHDAIDISLRFPDRQLQLNDFVNRWCNHYSNPQLPMFFEALKIVARLNQHADFLGAILLTDFMQFNTDILLGHEFSQEHAENIVTYRYSLINDMETLNNLITTYGINIIHEPRMQVKIQELSTDPANLRQLGAVNFTEIINHPNIFTAENINNLFRQLPITNETFSWKDEAALHECLNRKLGTNYTENSDIEKEILICAVNNTLTDDNIRMARGIINHYRRKEQLQRTGVGRAILTELQRLEPQTIVGNWTHGNKFSSVDNVLLTSNIDSIEADIRDPMSTIARSLASRRTPSFSRNTHTATALINVQLAYVRELLACDRPVSTALLAQLARLETGSKSYWPWHANSKNKLAAIVQSVLNLQDTSEEGLTAAVNNNSGEFHIALNQHRFFSISKTLFGNVTDTSTFTAVHAAAIGQ